MPSTIMNPFYLSKYRSCGELLAIVVVLCAVLSSCTKPKTPVAMKRYPFTGQVVSIDRQTNSALINGDMIQGYMEAMAMSYTLKPASTLAQLLPGDSISAEIVVIDQEQNQSQNKGASQPDYWLENVKVTKHAKTSTEHTELVSPTANGSTSGHV